MSIDRSRFKKSTASQLAQADKELNQTMGRRDNSNGHTIDEGANLFRIYPVHPDTPSEDDNFAQPFVQVFLPAMVQEKDKEGNVKMAGGKPVMKKSSRPVFNTKVHGNKPKDLVEEFIRIAREQAKDAGFSKSEYEEYMKPINGFYSKDPNKNIQGIFYPQAWVIYADKYPAANPAATPVFDEVKIKKSIKDRLNKISAIEAANDPLGTDPFSDINEGRAVRIFKDKNADQASNMYTTELDSSTTTEVLGNGKTVKVQVTFPLTDEQLEKFLQREPLAVKYGKKLATRKNFEAQLAGLQMVNDENQMGIFDLDEWADVVKEIDSYYPDVDPVDSSSPEGGENVEEQIETEDNSDEFDLMDRKELINYAKNNRTGIVVTAAIKDDVLKDKLRNWKINSQIVSEPLPNEVVEPKKEVVAEVKPTPVVETKREETPEERQAFIDDLNTPVVDPPKQTGEAAPMSAKEKLAALRAKRSPVA